jgi:hypothetical protein
MCMADALLTIILVERGIAKEANPLMAFFLNMGPAAFIFAKVGVLVPGIVACEYLKLQNFNFAKIAIRVGAFGYPALYVFGELKLHGFI